MDPLLTARLVIRELTPADAAFTLELLNEPGFHRYIGDRGIRDVAGAEKYLNDGPIASYARHGHGLWMVELKESREPVGICGLLKRDTLPHPDLGFAFLARHCGQGYGFESASAGLNYGRSVLRLPTILAITALENPASIKLLGKLGFRFERTVTLAGIAAPNRLFVFDRPA